MLLSLRSTSYSFILRSVCLFDVFFIFQPLFENLGWICLRYIPSFTFSSAKPSILQFFQRDLSLSFQNSPANILIIKSNRASITRVCAFRHIAEFTFLIHLFEWLIDCFLCKINQSKWAPNMINKIAYKSRAIIFCHATMEHIRQYPIVPC